MAHTAPGRVFIIRPDVEVASVTTLLDAACRQAAKAGWEVKTYRSRRVRMFEEAKERTVDFLEPEDATGLYRTLHQSDVLTLAAQQTYVRRDPSRDPPVRRAAETLESFLRYKGIFALIRSDRDTAEQLARFEEWLRAAPGCTGIDDPRALPFHVFETGREWDSLGDTASDRAFQKAYGPPHTRNDDGKKTWSRAQHRHGSLTLMISRCLLPDGAHWDVTAAGRKALIYTANKVWQLQDRRGSYANVYPDAHVRPTTGCGCRQVWPRRSA
jgi:hypothetical protein